MLKNFVRHFNSESINDISKFTPNEFRKLLGSKRRAFIKFDSKTKEFRISDNEFNNLISYFNDPTHALNRDMDNHEGMYFEVGQETNAIFSAYIHSTKRGAGAGGVRYWTYNNLSEYVCDGLRLSRGMGHKNALAGLWWGGGKAIIWREDSHEIENSMFREKLFGEYGKFITSLRGCYHTAEDLGVKSEDMASIFKTTRFVTCIPPMFGGSGNPSIKTGVGVVTAMEGALSYDNRTFDNIKINIQGFGNVAQIIVDNIFKRNLNVNCINVFDISPQNIINNKIDEIKKKYKNSNISLNGYNISIGDNSCLYDNVDIISPCATGGIINPNTIPNIKARYIVGAANNQLLDDIRDDKLIFNSNTLYIPDFLANRMGIVNCANECYGNLINDPAIERHFSKEYENSIYNMTRKVLLKSFKEKVPTGESAKLIAEELMQIEHPIWGHRSNYIQESLINNGWDSELIL